MNNYYVYVYIDPRNFEEFYYGKGKGSRKNAHLNDDSYNDKSKRIKAIKKEGLQPIIRVIARNLSEHNALLIEKALIWKLGKQLTNISSGHYKENFRPYDTLHKELSGYDFQNGLHFFNIGEGSHRSWDDCRKYGFISAGQGTVHSNDISGLHEGDVVAAYLNGRGFIGIGQITHKAKRVKEVRINGTLLLDLELKCPGMADNSDDKEKSEYVALVKWIKSVPGTEAKWKPNSGLFTPRPVRASLDGQTKTVVFLEQEFSVNFAELIK